MSDQPIRVGILGCASIAKRSLAPAFLAHPAFELIAVASRTEEKAKAFAEAFGIEPCTYDGLVFRSDIDLIYCPLPTGLHYAWVKLCLEAGHHVLCEKSLTCTEEECESLVTLARDRHRFLMESFQFRFHAQNLAVRRILESGQLGKIRQIVIRFGFPPFPDGKANIRYSRDLGGGALLDAGAYTLKAATYLLNGVPRVVAASSWSEPGAEVDLGGAVSLCSPEDVAIQTAYGFANSYRCGYEIWGSQGFLETTRAFTARADFPAEVRVQTPAGTRTETFTDDHFARLLDYVSCTIQSGSYEPEYRECLTQAHLLNQCRRMQ